jgi:hypothetical protein
LRMEPKPSPEETAAIMVALAAVQRNLEKPESFGSLRRSRWRLAGLLGHPPPRGMRLEGSLWSYSSWEGIV